MVPFQAVNRHAQVVASEGEVHLDSWPQTASAYSGISAGAVDLGNEPPLGLDLHTEEPTDFRRISIRWLAATVLTALSGASLMGGAVYAALDGEYQFAALPEIARLALKEAGDRISNISAKADRMSLLGEHVTARQIIRVSTTQRSGDHEVVRVRPFVRIATNLALAPSSLAADVPPFNPVKLMADAGNEHSGEETPQTEPTGDLTIVMRDLASLPSNTRTVGSVRSDDILMKLREAVENSTPGNKAISSLTGGGLSSQFGGLLAYASEGNIPFTAGGIPEIVENMSTVAKTTNEATGGNNWTERTLIAKKNDNIANILREVSAVPADIKGLLGSFGARGRDNGLKEGQRVRVLLAPGPNGQTVPLRVSIFNDQAHEASVALSDEGKYVAVEEPQDSSFAKLSDDDGDGGKGIRLYQSIYETALKNQVPTPMIDSMIRTFSFDVDLQRRVRAGDSIDILYADDENGIQDGDILYASINVGGEGRRYYRFQTEDDGIVDYYDEAGKSAKKFLVRKPLTGGVFRSGFGARNHPILGFTRMHTGVDWADDVGTPIFAAGNGTIISADWKGGYGRHIEIQHLNGYVTTYSHMSGFARGIEPGIKVRQGQVIGYIGTTGLSTGPHLHYEVKINGTFVDPMRIKLPRGRELDGAVLANFERERTRIDRILGNAPAAPRTAQLSQQ
jgi:murein DD-endopeptidase MepM/ murein hydrolase activator NlpD